MTDVVQSVLLGLLFGSHIVTVLRVRQMLRGEPSADNLLHKLNRELDGIQGWRIEHTRKHATVREGPDGLQVEIKREGSRG